MSPPDKPLLDTQTVARQLALLDSRWHVENDSLHAEFRFASFAAAMRFMQQVADLAAQLDHHPDWCNSYRNVTVRLTTHSRAGLTALDFALARQMDDVARQIAPPAE